jgi:hypothetical protein
MLSLKHLYAFLPPERLEALACLHQVDAEQSVKLSGPVLFLCLLNGLLNHSELSQRLLEETYHQQTGATLDHSTFGKCLSKIPVAYFADLFAQLHQKMQPQITPGTQQALKLRFVDATTVTLSAKLLSWGLLTGTCAPDKARRHLKSVLELSQEGLPNLLRVCQDKSESADSVALGATMKRLSHPNDLWVFDKGCHGRERLRAIHLQEAFWLTPLSQQHVSVLQTLFVLPQEQHPTQPPTSEQPTWVTVRVAQVVFQNSQVTQSSLAKWAAMPLLLVHGRRFDARTQTWKELVLMTNLPLSTDKAQAGPFTWDELAAVYRQRWAIEVFFKFIKQNLNYSHLISRCENGIKVMIYMSLIAALLLIWYKQQTGIDRGWRSVKFWLAENVRQWTQELLETVRIVDDD